MAKKNPESVRPDWRTQLHEALETLARDEETYEAEIAAVEARHREYLDAKRNLTALVKAHLAEIGSGTTEHAAYETVERKSFGFLEPAKAKDAIRKIVKLERLANIEVAELKPKYMLLQKLLTDEEKAKFGLADIPRLEFTWSRIG